MYRLLYMRSMQSGTNAIEITFLY